MKKTLLLLSIGVAALSMSAEVKEPYLYDFNTTIDTSKPNFKVGSNWSHIVGSVVDGSDESFMSYHWYASGGKDDSGYLQAGNQYASGNSYYDPSGPVFDYLITPLVKGEISVYAKPNNTEAYIEIYQVNEDGKAGDLIKKVQPTSGEGNWGSMPLLSADETGDSYKHYALRCSYLDIDDFIATSADISLQSALKIESIDPSATSGTLYWNQQPDGSVKVSYKLTVTNIGEVDLHAGDPNYSITVFNNDTKTDLFTVNIPVDIAQGATSEEFEITGYIAKEDVSTIWSGSWSTHKFGVRENCSENSVVLCYYGYKAYEPKFVIRKVGSTSTYNYSDPVKYGLVNAETDASTLTTPFEIYNDGAAPLTIVSMSLPEGFTGLPEHTDNFTVQPQERVEFAITLPAATLQPGVYGGKLEVKYLDKDANEQTYTLAVSGTVTAANAWTWDFGTSKDKYPAGAFADSGISTDYLSNNYYLKGASYNGNFILPKMHITPGNELSFETARESSNGTYNLKVYVGTDRYNWGEPVAEFTTEEVTSTTFQNVSVKFDDLEEGDYFVKMEILQGRIDNLCGPALAENPYDIYIKPDDSEITKQSGQEVSFNVKAIGITDLQVSDYTMVYRTDDEVLCTLDSKAISPNAKTEISFPVKFTPVVEATTTLNGYIQVTFADGSVIKSGIKPVTVTYQGDFVFNNPGITDSQWSKPSSLSTSSAIKFGVTNELGMSKEYEIFNWGAAPLAVSSISVPEGFSVTPESAVLEGKEHLPVTISVSATEPGTYEGKLVITYIELASAGEKTYELPISVTLLDSEKWYLPFNPENSNNNSVIWPAGTIHGKNISATNTGNYSEPIMAVNSSSATDNKIISPKLHAEEGDLLDIYAKLYSNSWSEGAVKVYTSATREGLENEETRTRVAVISGKTDTEGLTHTATSNWAVYQVEMPAGDYYVAFELTSRMYVNYFYGLKKVDVASDLKLQSSNVPSTVMQNTLSKYSVDLLNFAPAVVAAGDYTVAAYVDGEKVSEAVGEVEIPAALMYSDPVTTVSVPVRIPKVGTSSVYLTVTSGDQILSTEPVEVTVTPEVLSANKQVGEIMNAKYEDAPADLYFKNSQAIMLYTPDQLGLKNGALINQVSFAGYFNGFQNNTSDKDLKVYYALVDETVLAQPEKGVYDTSAMTQIMNGDKDTWAKIGTHDSAEDYGFVIDVVLDTPIEYVAGKSLLILVSSEGSTYATRSNFSWLSTNESGNCYTIAQDNYSTYSSLAWNMKALPVLFLGLKVEPVEVSGNITADGEVVEGATVTFISTDGDNVQYEATTDAEGNYSINIVQNSREYDIVASYDNKVDYADAMTFGENSILDFDLLDLVEIKDADFTEMHQASENAHVKVDLQVVSGFNSIVLPFSLTKEEVEELFGINAEVLKFGNSHLDESGNLTLYFESLENKAMETGVPYLLKSEYDGFNTTFKGKAVSVAYKHLDDISDNVEFRGTYEPIDVDQNMYLLSDDMFIPSQPAARSVEKVLPYRAYVYVVNPEVQNINFTIDNLNATAVEDLDIDQLDENAVIYNLQGLRVYNPGTGIYIINGKKVMLK